ncbi:hypothetical protein F5Y11DRAFT_344692 [Daldinia sp. FL1419]|nr:hypothetical protein F5Y11DRAFT_344692 [Daldinia sp. FL1419]
MGVASEPSADDTSAESSTQAIQSDGLYYVYASSAEQSPSDDVTILEEGSPIDTFNLIQIPLVQSYSARKEWDFKASLIGLYASTLVGFFDDDSKAHLGPLINSIAIDTLTAEYKCDLEIAEFSLGLKFTYKDGNFTFSAALNPKDKAAEVVDVLVSILGSDIELPNFVYNTPLVGDDEDVFRFDVVKNVTSADDNTSKVAQVAFFVAQFNFGNTEELDPSLETIGQDLILVNDKIEPELRTEKDVKYKDKMPAVIFDATFELGQLGFSLVGFSLGLSFTTLEEGPTITPVILGLAASFEQPPLSITGVIRHGNDGGLDSSSFKSVFIFAKLNGPLVTLEFAEINSTHGGLSHNSSIQLPTVEEVYDFPFIASSQPEGSGDATEALEKLVDPGAGVVLNSHSPLIS